MCWSLSQQSLGGSQEHTLDGSPVHHRRHTHHSRTPASNLESRNLQSTWCSCPLNDIKPKLVKLRSFWPCCGHDAPQFQIIQQLRASNNAALICSSKLETSKWMFKTWKPILKIRFWLIAWLCVWLDRLCGMTQLLAKIDQACFPCRGNQHHQDFYCGKKMRYSEYFHPLWPRIVVVRWLTAVAGVLVNNRIQKNWFQTNYTMMNENLHYSGFQVQCWSSCTNCHQSCLNLDSITNGIRKLQKICRGGNTESTNLQGWAWWESLGVHRLLKHPVIHQ